MGTCLFGEGSVIGCAGINLVGRRLGHGAGGSMVICSHSIYSRLPPIIQMKYLTFTGYITCPKSQCLSRDSYLQSGFETQSVNTAQDLSWKTSEKKIPADISQTAIFHLSEDAFPDVTQGIF